MQLTPLFHSDEAGRFAGERLQLDPNDRDNRHFLVAARFLNSSVIVAVKVADSPTEALADFDIEA